MFLSHFPFLYQCESGYRFHVQPGPVIHYGFVSFIEIKVPSQNIHVPERFCNFWFGVLAKCYTGWSPTRCFLTISTPESLQEAFPIKVSRVAIFITKFSFKSPKETIFSFTVTFWAGS